MKDLTIATHDGRVLGIAEFGDPAGSPVFYCHGFPSSRIEGGLLAAASRDLSIRLVAVDRPGMGLSEYLRGRRLLDWPDDVAAIADALGIDRFAILGTSGGGPYALACAYRMPERVTRCGLAAGTGPIYGTSGKEAKSSRMIGAVARRVPFLVRLMLWREIGRHCDNRDKAAALLRKQAQQLPLVDQEFFLEESYQGQFVDQVIASFDQGTKGPVSDVAILFGHSWGFRPEDILGVDVFVWHGELDQSVPISMGRDLAARIKGARSIFFPDEGHISLLTQRGEAMLAALVR